MEALMRNIDRKDRLILALAALLRAERETRGALQAALQNDSVNVETLRAILSDPVPVVTEEDILFAEDFARSRQLPPFHLNSKQLRTTKETF
jgi:alkylhydroperoxidase/carboxymuconolactone decarboxylase family protein YurZ